RGIVGEAGTLDEPDRTSLEQHELHVGRVGAVDRRTEVAFDRLRAVFVVPPARHVRLGQPPRQRREVVSGEGPEPQPERRVVHHPRVWYRIRGDMTTFIVPCSFFWNFS